MLNGHLGGGQRGYSLRPCTITTFGSITIWQGEIWMRGGNIPHPLHWPLGSSHRPLGLPRPGAQAHECGTDPTPDPGVSKFLRWQGSRSQLISRNGGLSTFVDFLVSPSEGPWTGSILHWGITMDAGGTYTVYQGIGSVPYWTFCRCSPVTDNIYSVFVI